MGLIEKAVDTMRLREEPAKFSAANKAPVRQETFSIDFEALRANGFYAPNARSTSLALELRVIKRRLLRRLGFFARSGDDRVMRNAGRRRNLIMVTSTRPAEGKTFTAVNLALSLALEEEIDTLLVDADAPRPKVRAHLGLPEGPGLTDCILDGSRSPAETALAAEGVRLQVLREGAPVARAGELFGSPEAQQFFVGLSTASKGRLIILDAPPVLATAEAAILARHVDEIVFVVEADATPEPAVASALDELLDVNPNVSLVLNRCLLPGGGTHYGSYERYENIPNDGPGGGPRAAGDKDNSHGQS